MIVIYLPHDNLETDMQAIDLIDDHRPEIRLGIERMPSTRLLGLKLLGLGPRRYFHGLWNRFDFSLCATRRFATRS